MKKLFFDLETTGTMHWKNGIHQISGCIEIDEKIVEDFNFKVRPNPVATIDPEALKIAGVSIDVVSGYPSMQEVYQQFVTMLAKFVDKYDKTDKFFLIGYNNAAFDNAFLRAWFVQNGDNYFGSWFWANGIDVMVMASEYLLERRQKMSDFKLKTVAMEMGIAVDEARLHDASYDIYLTWSIYHIINHYRKKPAA